MPEPLVFPHLNWLHQGPFDASFNGARQNSPEADAARANRRGHAQRIRGQIDAMKRDALAAAAERREAGLPDITGKGFLLRVPDGTDVDGLAHALGIELVAETERGLMFAATDDLDLARLEEVLANFEVDVRGGGNAANVFDVFHEGDDERKLAELLVGHVYDLWPFNETTVYTFDLGIQTAASSHSVEWTRLPRRQADQTREDRAAQQAALRLQDMIRAEESWMEAADERFAELQAFVGHYGGEMITGLRHDEPRQTRKGVVFPDSIEVRVRMSGKGFRDLVENLRNLFEVSLPPDIRYLPGSPEAEGEEADLDFLPPDEDAPNVCVIDSGIQEGHRWLESAINKPWSRCFLPDLEVDDVADQVRPRGHGTRVAGAVLYPREVPKTGVIQPVAWIQNARVLDSDNRLPESLPAERYLTEVVAHFTQAGSGTKIFNHSISESKPCESRRMCAWAAKLDDLSHRNDLLFLQIAGNLSNSEIYAHLGGGGFHPAQLLEYNAKVASPGQSLHALTIGSVAHAVVVDGPRRSFATVRDFPSAFSRSGYSPLWSVVKPEVVEYGGDNLGEVPPTQSISTNSETAPELVASTLHGEPAISRDDVGTSFAAPKVAHIAAHLQRLFPTASPQLYRALIVQSARWPDWAVTAEPDSALRLVGFGIPSLERATTNSLHRVTLITEDSKEIWSKQYHLYRVPIPQEIRRATLEARVRIDVTLAYTASPRRTRSRRTGYLETWLDWRSIGREEPIEHFRNRMEGNGDRYYRGLPWVIHPSGQHGEVEVSRDRGSVQKDWAVVEANELPENFAIAVRAHVGWNHKEGGGFARYCLAVSFEALDAELPIYTAIETGIRLEARTEIEEEIDLF